MKELVRGTFLSSWLPFLDLLENVLACWAIRNRLVGMMNRPSVLFELHTGGMVLLTYIKPVLAFTKKGVARVQFDLHWLTIDHILSKKDSYRLWRPGVENRSNHNCETNACKCVSFFALAYAQALLADAV
jgi:hypothetical protein